MKGVRMVFAVDSCAASANVCPDGRFLLRLERTLPTLCTRGAECSLAQGFAL